MKLIERQGVANKSLVFPFILVFILQMVHFFMVLLVSKKHSAVHFYELILIFFSRLSYYIKLCSWTLIFMLNVFW
ncbi:hypothetical protein Syun_021440 [Stephania yunnanensis]|uniref:Uncharacterized protein n=1 Tax=Stephania yunnanensis TaxID=152371 RepID=A0AAP0IFS1_9MAGN